MNAEVQEDIEDVRLSLAKEYITAIEKGDDPKADTILEEITSVRETQLFQEVGKLTRQLHQAMANFTLDSKLAEMTENDIPDAKERLNYVITMTQQSADTTLNAVEELIPLSENLSEQSYSLEQKWKRFLQKDMDFNEFKKVSSELTEYFSSTATDLQTVQDKLNEVLMAQSYQDITGQIIKRVINLVHDVELSMVDIIRFSGARLTPAPSDTEQSASKLEGPAVPAISGEDTIASQDGVDDLLSSLGF